MRRAGRAIALDPENEDAAGIVSALAAGDELSFTDLKSALGRILRLCAGGSLVPIELGEAAAPPPGVVARVLRFLRTRPHGDAHTNAQR